MKQPTPWKSVEQSRTEVQSIPPKVGFWNSAKNTLWFILWLVSFLLLGVISTSVGWVAIIPLAIPFYIFSEWLSGKLFTAEAGWSTSQTGFSLKRIIVGVVVLSALVFAVLIGTGILN